MCFYNSIFSFIPESFRWYVTRSRRKDARRIVHQVARWNKRSVSEDVFVKMCRSVEKQDAEKTENYSLIVLFRKMSLFRLTLPLMVCWYEINVVVSLYMHSLIQNTKKWCSTGNVFSDLRSRACARSRVCLCVVRACVCMRACMRVCL